VAPLEPPTLLTASIIETVAGNGMGDYTGDGGPALSAGFGTATGNAVDANGNIFLADGTHDMIHELDVATGIITTIAGSDAMPGYSGDGGPASRAELNDPQGLALDASGNLLYIADRAVNGPGRPGWSPTQVYPVHLRN
jgi:DNA-binding beta-propeller fold protein YncE